MKCLRRQVWGKGAEGGKEGRKEGGGREGGMGAGGRSV